MSTMLIGVVGLALLACGPAGTTTKQEQSPLAPLKRTAGKDPHTTAKGGIVLDPAGKEVDLATAYASANAFIVFYRGAWWPHCRKQLVELQEHYSELVQEGAYVFALSVDTPDKAGEIKAKLKLSFPVYSDKEGRVARRWGVLNEKTDISKPATFLVTRGGTIVYKKVGEDMTDRPDPDDLVKLAAKANTEDD